MLAPRPGSYSASHPTGQQTLLAVEVSGSRRPYDFDQKLTLYARHGVQEAWIADVANSQLHVFRGRTDVGFVHSIVIPEPGKLAVPSLDGIEVDLAGLFSFLMRAD